MENYSAEKTASFFSHRADNNSAEKTAFKLERDELERDVAWMEQDSESDDVTEEESRESSVKETALVPTKDTTYDAWVEWLPTAEHDRNTVNIAILQRYLPSYMFELIKAKCAENDIRCHKDIPRVISEHAGNSTLSLDTSRMLEDLHNTLQTMVDELLRTIEQIQPSAAELYKIHIGTVVNTTLALATKPVDHLQPCLSILLQDKQVQDWLRNEAQNAGGLKGYVEGIALPYSKRVAEVMARMIEEMAPQDAHMKTLFDELVGIGSDQENQELVAQVFANAKPPPN